MLGGAYLRFRLVTGNIIFKEVRMIIDEVFVAVDDDWRVGFGVLLIGDFTSGNAGTIVWIFIIVILIAVVLTVNVLIVFVVVVAHGDIT
jgi:hypothetical protein